MQEACSDAQEVDIAVQETCSEAQEESRVVPEEGRVVQEAISRGEEGRRAM